MQQHIKQHPEFKSRICNDPMELLKATKQLMHDPVRAWYPFVTLTNTLVCVTGLQQNEHEPLLDYVKCFKQQHDVLKSVIGKKVFDDFIKNTKEYRNESDATKQQQMKTVCLRNGVPTF